MARMIPAAVSADTKSDAERKLFPHLKKMPDTDNWTILHSVNIADHETQMQGETDFMVFIPGEPVLLLEVKGGEVSCDDDGWYSIDRNDVVHDLDPDPIDEANNAMQSVIAHLKRRGAPKELQRTLFGYGVMFPDTTYHGVITSLEISDEQVADYDDCLTPDDLKKYVLKLAAHWKKNKPQMLHAPTAPQCSELIRWIRPNFTGKVSLKSQIHSVENEVYVLTEQQKAAFETIAGNDRCLVVGEAGTGKTLIATDFACDKADEGLHVGFFCYNRLLGNHLTNSVHGKPAIESGSFTMFMEEVVKRAGTLPGEIDDPVEKSAYYSVELPNLFMNAYVDLELPEFDVLILDEAQDLMTEEYLAAMDLILEGGLSNGSWYFFMDAQRQNLYRSGADEAAVKKMLKKYGAYFTRSVLKENCRNSAAIIEKIDAVFGMETQYRARDERGPEVKIRSFKNLKDQNDVLKKVLGELEAEHVEKDDIVILSPFRVENSAAGHIEDLPAAADPEDRKGRIFCGTIQAFKGLESPVVILTNLVDVTRDSMRDLLYVGMTRAKSLLYILASESVAKALQ
ncbi:MAG: ATP-binding domain-containing protein [Lachnospiraceae bacterium]|nr:ATP-binding domain-containing protein [Lachnospiraceae bacterium]